MSKKSIIERERNRLYFRNRYGILRNFLRGKIKNSLSLSEKFFYQSCLQALPRDSSTSKNFTFYKLQL